MWLLQCSIFYNNFSSNLADCHKLTEMDILCIVQERRGSAFLGYASEAYWKCCTPELKVYLVYRSKQVKFLSFGRSSFR